MTTSTISHNRLVRALLPPAFWLGAWQLGAMAIDAALGGHGNELLLPYPASVAAAFVSLAGTKEFWLTALLSLARILAGMTLGTLLGLALATLTSAFPLADAVLSPAIRVVRAAPVVSFILLVLLWVHRGWVPVVISAMMVLPVVWANLSRGIQETDPKLLELARAYRFSTGRTIRLIYAPCVRPYFLTALSTAMGLAWKSGIAAEVLCLPPLSVGREISNARLYLLVPELFAWTALVVALSLLLERLIARLLDRWKGGEA